MNVIGAIPDFGLVTTPTPVQLCVGAAVVGVGLLSTAKRLLKNWYVLSVLISPT
jgi:hypothetical protein